MKLYTYFRSTASYRIRIALNFKNIPHELIPIDLIHDKHKDDEFKNINPHARVPVLIDKDFKIGQSIAILEYLEEKYPSPALLPKSLEKRAMVRYISQIIVSDMHPLNNSAAIKYLSNHFHLSQDKTMAWYYHWLKNGFDALETLIAKSSNKKFCIDEKLTLADICLIPQIYNAFRFSFSMKNYPTLLAINDYCLSLDYFDQARPENQVDYIDRPGKVVP